MGKTQTTRNESTYFCQIGMKRAMPDNEHLQYRFFDDVYAVARLIPRGRVTSYGAIAEYLGAKKSARMVGWAMNAAHTDPTVPAHRVVNRDGLLTGRHHFATPTTMQTLLEREHVEIENHRVIHFKELFWSPYKELT